MPLYTFIHPWHECTGFPKRSSYEDKAMAMQNQNSDDHNRPRLALAEKEKCEYWTADTRLWNAVADRLPWVRRLSDYQSS
jgi:hypothetical protein